MTNKSKKIKTEWDLGVFYKSPKDPKIEKDLLQIEVECLNFEKKYRNKTDYLKNENALFKALSDYEKLYAFLDGAKPVLYYFFLNCLDSRDDKISAALNKASLRLTSASNKVLFFELNLGKIDKKIKNQFLKNKKLSGYKHFLCKIFKNSAYDLTEPEEKILNLKSLPGRRLWIQGVEKLLNSQIVKFQGKNIPINEAMGLFSNLPTKDRRTLHFEITKILEEMGHFAESEINAVYLDKKIDDELRGFKEPYHRTVLSYENDLKTVENLIRTVTKNFKISQRFYKLKAKLLKVSYLEYADRAAGVGVIKTKFEFDGSLQILRSGFSKIGQKYLNILDRMLENGQVDVFPKTGKHGGGFCLHSIDNPTFVLLNYVDNMNSIKIFAHEMGHAIHSEMSKNQRPIYQNYTSSVAEVASTLFENFLFDEIFDKLSEKEKVVALHNRINDSIGTIFRQIACFNFELDLHGQIRSKGSLSKEEIAGLHNKNMAAYMGKIAKFKEEDGYFFVAWPHIRNFFYVYSYAYGELISNAIYARIKKDPKYMNDVDKFLSAGSSMSPEEIFKMIGIDTAKAGFWQEGLKKIEDDIILLEKLTKKYK